MREPHCGGPARRGGSEESGGVRAEIIRLSRLPLTEVALIASSHKEVMILTDFDRKGEELAGKLLRYLEGYPCRVDSETRRELKRIAKKDIKGIEELYGLYLKVVSVSGPPTWRGGFDEEEEDSVASYFGRKGEV